MSRGAFLVRLSLGLGLALTHLVAAAEARERVALVIGNNAYQNVSVLQKAVNDAASVASSLEAQGFAVMMATDLERREMNRAITRFTSAINPGDVAFIFYAGHGVEIDGENYLLPIDIPDARSGDEDFVKAEAIGLSRLLDRVRAVGATINIAIIDACRDNPFDRVGRRSLGGTRGLSRIVAPEGLFVIFSAGAGQSALDGLGPDDDNPNSVFTRALLPLLSEPDLSIRELAIRLRREVNALASIVSHRQVPAYYDEMIGHFSFGSVASDPQTDPTREQDRAKAAYEAARDAASRPALRFVEETFAGTVYAILAHEELKRLEREQPVVPSDETLAPKTESPPIGETEASTQVKSETKLSNEKAVGAEFNNATSSSDSSRTDVEKIAETDLATPISEETISPVDSLEPRIPAEELQAGAETEPSSTNSQSSTLEETENSLQLSRVSIREAQELLNAIGHDSGPEDGLIGRKTRAAIRDFQSSLGVKATGFFSQDLLVSLRAAGTPQLSAYRAKTVDRSSAMLIAREDKGVAPADTNRAATEAEKSTHILAPVEQPSGTSRSNLFAEVAAWLSRRPLKTADHELGTIEFASITSTLDLEAGFSVTKAVYDCPGGKIEIHSTQKILSKLITNALIDRGVPHGYIFIATGSETIRNSEVNTYSEGKPTLRVVLHCSYG